MGAFNEWQKLLTGTKPSQDLVRGLKAGKFQEISTYAARLSGAQQPPQWHPEGDAWVHTMMTLDAAAAISHREGLTGDVALHIMFGALCHDFGKGEPGITKIIDGKWTSRGHEEAGLRPTREFFGMIGAPEGLIQIVTGMVIGHFRPVALYKQCTLSGITHNPDVFLKYLWDISPAIPEEVLLVTEADQGGCGAPRDCTVFQGDIFLPREWLLVKIAETKKQGESPGEINSLSK